MYSAKPLQSKVTLPYLQKLKQQQQKFACLTAYDYSFAQLEERNGVEVVLVGDTLGMLIQGHDTTLPVSVDDIAYHGAIVRRGLDKAFLMLDMPFGSVNSAEQALSHATQLMKATSAHAVKLEGGMSQIESVRMLSDYSIPVCAHLGLQPQSVNKLGSYRVQGRGDSAAEEMKQTALELQNAGADLLLLECVPAALAAEITQSLSIPVIGIGAGPDCDGQILVLQDMLGITSGRIPSFVHNFMSDSESIDEAVGRYVAAVKNGSFPASQHCFN